MGRKGVSLVDVIRATVALRKQGRVAGPWNLRLELGRGSYSTIGRHVRRLALVDPGVRRPRASMQQVAVQHGRGQRATGISEAR
jgi:hypothetical protein